eukprot:CAMPEP_0194208808 /NCGR_PEP_ID=MMETSP0156-20130528/7150_1 /TAXON_ID=33649 /ORGANISM="Thalassionema nitzschioides, Strain L26-B" /LENGTH=634 /DNA_ID=CAMNT_0038935849 /DNA_START=17 /DNA_END=1921 /DNA_ORIENTATION=-
MADDEQLLPPTVVAVVDELHTADGANRLSKEKEAQAPTISNYVQVAKNALKVQIRTIQAQQTLLLVLERQPEEQKLDTLFLLLDKDQNGIIDAVELVDFMRKMDGELTYLNAIHKAIDYVAQNDDDVSGALDREEFRHFLDTLCAEAGYTFAQMSEVILLNVYMSQNGNSKADIATGKKMKAGIQQQVQKKATHYSAKKDPRMRTLFKEFDTDNTGSVDYQEAAIGLYKLIGDMKESALEAFDLLLMYDENDDRLMDYNEFVHLMLHACALKDKTWSEVADALVYAIRTNPEPSAEDIAKLNTAEEYYGQAAKVAEQSEQAAQVLSALHYQKFMKLYDIIDSNDDGLLSFQELSVALRKYVRVANPDMSLEESIVEMRSLLLEFDKDENQQLDRDEFVLLLIAYSQYAQVDLHKLIDTLAVLVLTDGDAHEEEYIQQIAIQNNSGRHQQQVQANYGMDGINPEDSDDDEVDPDDENRETTTNWDELMEKSQPVSIPGFNKFLVKTGGIPSRPTTPIMPEEYDDDDYVVYDGDTPIVMDEMPEDDGGHIVYNDDNDDMYYSDQKYANTSSDDFGGGGSYNPNDGIVYEDIEKPNFIKTGYFKKVDYDEEDNSVFSENNVVYGKNFGTKKNPMLWT